MHVNTEQLNTVIWMCMHFLFFFNLMNFKHTPVLMFGVHHTELILSERSFVHAKLLYSRNKEGVGLKKQYWVNDESRGSMGMQF